MSASRPAKRPTETRSYRGRSDGVVITAEQRRMPLSASSINALIQMLPTLLDVAIEQPDALISPQNAAVS